MTDAEKLAFYLKRGSHEVDLFLFHKDPAFFKSHISPLLKEGYLSFLEQWMLKRDLSAYLAPRRFESLNLFEQILLLKGVTQSQSRETGKTNQRERRESLLRYLKQRLKAEPTPKTRLYSLFQAAIAQSLEQAPPPPPRAEGSSIEISLGASAPMSASAPMPLMEKMADEAEVEDEVFAERSLMRFNVDVIKRLSSIEVKARHISGSSVAILITRPQPRA